MRRAASAGSPIMRKEALRACGVKGDGMPRRTIKARPWAQTQEKRKMRLIDLQGAERTGISAPRQNPAREDVRP